MIILFTKYFFEKVVFEKKITRRQKSMQKLPIRLTLTLTLTLMHIDICLCSSGLDTRQVSNGFLSGYYFLPTVKPVLSAYLKIEKKQMKGLMKNGSLMKVESIYKCSPWSILQYFNLH